MLELTFLSIDEELLSSHDHERPGDDTHNHGCKQFLSDPIDRATMEVFNLQGDFFITVIAFHFPPPEIEGNDLISGKGDGVQQVSQQHRHRAIGTNQQDGPKFDGFEPFALARTDLRKSLVGWADPEDGFRFATFYKGFNGREGATGGAAEDKVAVELFGQQVKQVIAGIAPIKEPDTVGRNKGQQLGSFLSF